MSEKKSEIFGRDVYDVEKNESALRSARVILSLLYEIYLPESVVEFGCSSGAWLAAAEALGSSILVGYDIPHIDRSRLLSKNIDYRVMLLSQDPLLDKRYDLAMSLEFAEHLPAERSGSFVRLLCRASDVVLFSAAIKYQGGVGHINEQWPSNWIRLFQSNGFECVDVIRGRIWRNESVVWYYRQNCFLFVNPAAVQLDLNSIRLQQGLAADLVHPTNYEIKFNRFYQEPNLRLCLSVLKGYLVHKFIRSSNRQSR